MPANSRTRPRLVQRTRDAIFDIIGRECALAEVDGEACDGPLEVDHMFGRDWTPSKVSSYGRNRRYLREAFAGLLRPLCKHHNETVRPQRGAPATAPQQLEAQPF